MGGRYRLECINCGKIRENSSIRCDCGGILTPVYSMDSAGETIPDVLQQSHLGTGRFSSVLPLDPGRVSMGEGDTPLLKSRIGKSMGLKNLYFKNETLNPTGSFKDRILAILVALAIKEGYRSVLLASTGNAGISLSAYASRCGITPFILVDEGIPVEKLGLMSDLNARITGVRDLFRGTHQELIALLDTVSKELNAYNAFCWALANPFSTEGVKIISYELTYQMKEPPDLIVTPVGGGDNLFGIWKGYTELYRMGMIDKIPEMIGVQSERACPLVKSWEMRADHVLPVKNPDSIASGINVAFTGDHALRALRESGGRAIAVTDRSIVEGKKRLAREGIMVETTSGCVIPAVEKLQSEGYIDHSDTVVCILTGSGLKETYTGEMRIPAVNKTPEKIVSAIRSGKKR